MSLVLGLALVLLRWLAATAVGIAVVIALTLGLAAGPVGFGVAALTMVGLPLLVVRRWPTIGGWLASAMLVAVPLSLLMTAVLLDRPLVVSHVRCGTADVALWIMGVPMGAALASQLTGILWARRTRMARLWRPASLVVLALGLGLLLPGAFRTLWWGPVTDTEAVLAEAEVVTLADAAPNGTTTDEAAGLVIERECTEGACEVSLRAATESDDEMRSLPYESWSAAAPVMVYALDDVRVIEAEAAHSHRARVRVAIDINRVALHDLRVRDVADGFGPSPAALGLMLVALLAVLGSSRLSPYTPLVWRRLGARQAEQQAGRLEEIIALRMVHLAVLVIASLPILASACLGLVL